MSWKYRSPVVAVIASVVLSTSLRADTINTAAGESIAGREAKVADGVFVIPPGDKAEEKKLPLADLQSIAFAPGKPLGELKTRFVRIELQGNGKALGLAEVQAFEGDKNVAQDGKARQALTYMDDDEVNGAQKAIDGKTGGDSRNDGVTRTAPQVNPWWEVDLKKDATIKKLVIFPRTDGNVAKSLDGCRILLLNDKRGVLWTKTFAKAPTPKIETDVPLTADKLSADDLKAIEKLGAGGGDRPPLAAILDAWVRNAKVIEAAPKPDPAGAANPRLGRGGFSAESPQTPTAAAQTANNGFPDGEYLIRFEPEGLFVGKVKSWNDKGLSVEFPLVQQTIAFTIPTAAVREVVSKDLVTKKIPLDRAQISTDADTVFAKAEGNALQPVSGTVKGIEGDALQFEFQGKVRTIKLARVAAIFRRVAPSDPATPAFGVLELSNAMRLPGRITSLADDKCSFELPWKESFEVSRGSLRSMNIQNGRVVALTSLEPTKVDYVALFDRILPMKKNESLTGAPLEIGTKRFEQGLCAHSGTTLTYDLSGQYEKLRVQIGLQTGDGARGQAIVRFKGDDAVLIEKPVAGTASPETIDVSVAGKKTLVIEIDYGDGLDVGDHVVLGEPVLVRTSTP